MDKRESNKIFESFKEDSKKFETPPEPKQQQAMDGSSGFDFELPTETVPLPTKGLIYPANHALHKKESADIRCMTAKDEDILTSRALIRKGTVIDVLIKNCLIDKTIDVRNLTSGDRNALMIGLRITGYGQDYTIEVDCPGCNNRQKHSFDLSNLPIKRLKIKPLEEFQNKFSFTLPKMNKEVTFRFLTGNDETELTKTFDRARKVSEVESVVTTRLAHSIVSIDGNTNRSFISKVVRNMPALDSLALRQFIEENEPGIQMDGEITCVNCGWDGEVEIPIGVEFFWPQGRG
jgi:hypothetical protein